MASFRQEFELFANNDPWDDHSSTTSNSNRRNLRDALCKQYAEECMVSDVTDNVDAKGSRVVAAHLWPRSKTSLFVRWQQSIREDVCDDIDDARNGMFLLQDIETAYDKKKIFFLCHPFQLKMQLKVLDPRIKNKKPAGCTKTFKELEQVVIEQPKITRDRRPSFKILSRHAMKAIETAPKKWLTEEQKRDLYAVIQVISPEPSPAKGSVHTQ